MPRRSKSAGTSKEEGSGPSKAELIRQTASELGKPFRPRDIVAALKEKGVEVGYTQISKALRAGGLRRRGRRKKVGAGAAGSASNGAAHSAAHGGKINKAQHIRDAAKRLGKRVRPKDIIAELAKDGIEVSSAQVSTTLSAAGYRRRGRRRGAGAGGKAAGGSSASGKSTSLDLDALIATKALVEKIGGIENAEEAIKALKRLS